MNEINLLMLWSTTIVTLIS